MPRYNMGACELCGKEGVGTRRAKVSQSVLECCSGCIASMGLVVEQRPTKVIHNNEQSSLVTGKGVSGIDIMTKDATELAGDFHSRISDGRKIKGMTQEDLARSMNVKIGVIQKAENGNRPMDSTLEKFEKALGISLFVEAIPRSNTMVANESSSQMTISDAKNVVSKKTRKRPGKKKGRRFGVSRSGSRSRR
ncbi:MAG TPA: helix-turn-helix domain-containing protein [Candidatus Poseidoniales archaeon]|nr:MAG TPA: helix-turn-helix domain-containing protein [Candidatus Poseidoniales archaeon]